MEFGREMPVFYSRLPMCYYCTAVYTYSTTYLVNLKKKNEANKVKKSIQTFLY